MRYIDWVKSSETIEDGVWYAEDACNVCHAHHRYSLSPVIYVRSANEDIITRLLHIHKVSFFVFVFDS